MTVSPSPREIAFWSSIFKGTFIKRLTSSIGKPLPDVEVKIVNEQGKVVPPFEVGEILARGSRIMTGYWKDDEKTSQVITKDGWLRTADRGWMDEDGYIYLAGRGDDMIIRGGENISPEEVENVLHSHPDIEEQAKPYQSCQERGASVTEKRKRHSDNRQ